MSRAEPGGGRDWPLVVLLGATASGKTGLAIRLAEQFGGEIVSCDSVAVYRQFEIGTAKPSREERARVPHHLIDVVEPDQVFTAGQYARLAREALGGIRDRGRLPIVAGGTGLYLRALIDGLFPEAASESASASQPAHAASDRRESWRVRLRARAASEDPRFGPHYLHRMLGRLDASAAAAIHVNDVPKVVRAIEASLRAGRPMTEQWGAGRDALRGFRVLRLGLDPPRELLYERINCRAAEMFDAGLVEETERLVKRYGYECRPLGSLGYRQAVAVLRGEMTREQAVDEARQGHRNYAKRQGTWFRREPGVEWMRGRGQDPAVESKAVYLVRAFIG